MFPDPGGKEGEPCVVKRVRGSIPPIRTRTDKSLSVGKFSPAVDKEKSPLPVRIFAGQDGEEGEPHVVKRDMSAQSVPRLNSPMKDFPSGHSFANYL